jgi:hypothetical protein
LRYHGFLRFGKRRRRQPRRVAGDRLPPYAPSAISSPASAGW